MRLSGYVSLLILLVGNSCTNKSQQPDSDTVPDSSSNLFPDTSSKTLITDSIQSGLNEAKTYDCSILNQKVNYTRGNEQWMRNMRLLVNCGIDSFDLVYIVPNLVPRFVEEAVLKNQKTLTYSDIVNHIHEFKSSGEYTQLYRQVMTLDSLRALPFSAKDIDRIKPVLGRLGFSELEWESFLQFAKTYPLPKDKRMSWRDMLDAYDGYTLKNN